MNKTLRLEYYPIIDHKSKNPLVANGSLNDYLKMSFNGSVVWPNIELASEQLFNGGCTREASVEFNPDRSNSINLVNVQMFNGSKINIIGTTVITPVSDTHWNIRYTYDWRGVEPEHLQVLNNAFKVGYEGFTFKINDYVLNDVVECTPGSLYTNSDTIVWDTQTPLEFLYEENDVSYEGVKFVQALKYTLI